MRAGGEQQSVAVGRRLGDKLTPDNPVGSAAVVDDDLLFKALAELRGHNIRHDAGRASRRKRHDKGDWPVWIARAERARANPEPDQEQR